MLKVQLSGIGDLTNVKTIVINTGDRHPYIGKPARVELVNITQGHMNGLTVPKSVVSSVSLE